MKTTRARDLSRRRFLGAAAAVPFLGAYHRLAAAERKRVKIRDLQTMMMQGASRTYVLVQDHLRRRAVRHRRGLRNSRRRREGADPLPQAVAGRQGSAGDRRPVHGPGSAHERPLRHPHGWLRAQLAARRQRHRDGAVGPGRQRSRRARQHAARRKIPQTASASTIMQRRATCWTKRPAASGRRR